MGKDGGWWLGDARGIVLNGYFFRGGGKVWEGELCWGSGGVGGVGYMIVYVHLVFWGWKFLRCEDGGWVVVGGNRGEWCWGFFVGEQRCGWGVVLGGGGVGWV